MADLNDYVKSFDNVIRHLEELASKASKVKSSVDPATKSIQSMSSAMSKMDFDAFVDGATNVKNFSKEVISAEKKIADFYDEVEKSIEVTKSLSVESSDYLKNIKKLDKGIGTLTDSLQEKRERLNSVTKSMLGLEGSLKGLKKTGAVSFFNNMIGKLSELKGVVSDQGALASFEKRIRDLDNIAVDNLPDEIRKVTEEFNNLKFDSSVGKKSIAKLGESFKSGLQKTLASMNKSSRVGAETLANNLDKIAKTDSFTTLTKESQDFIQKFISDIRSSTIPFDELEKKMTEFSAIVEQLSGQESETIKKDLESVAEQTKKGIELHQKLNKSLEKPKVLSVSLDFETSKITDTINALEQKSNLVGLSDAEREKLTILVEQKKEISEQKERVSSLASELLKHKEGEASVLDLEKKITAQNNKILKQAKMNNALAQRHLRIMDEVENGSAGEKRIQGISDYLVTAEGHLNKYKEHMEGINDGLSNVIGGLAGKLGGAMGKIGDGLMKYKASFGVIASLVGVMQTLIQADAQVKKAFKEVADSGVLVGTSVGDIEGQLKKTGVAAANFGGLAKAFRGIDGAVVMTKENILAMNKALTSSGMSMAKMEEQTHSMNKSLDKSESGIVEAAEMAHVLGAKLGKSDTEMMAMVGDLSYQYGATLGSIKDGFSDVASAAQSSTMGANKFMSVVQAATAGMSLYEDQIVDTAKAISKMEGTGLKGKEMGQAAKSSAEFAQDPKKVMNALGMVLSKEGGKAQIEAMADKMTTSMEALKKQAAAEKAKGTPEGDAAAADLQEEIDNLNEGITNMRKAANGNAAAMSDASQMFATFPAEVKQNLMGGIIDFFKESAGTGEGSKTIFTETAAQAGIDPAMIAQELKTRSKSSQALMGTAPGQGSKVGEKKDFQTFKKEVAKTDQLTNSTFLEALKGFKDYLTMKFGPLITALEVIVGLFIAYKAFMMGKGIMNALRGGKDGGGGGGVIDLLKNVLSKKDGPPPIPKEALSKSGSVVGGMMDKAKGLFSAGGEGGGFTKVLGKSLGPLKMLGRGAKLLGKFMGPIGMAVSATTDAIGGWQSAGELSGKGDKATTGDKLKGALSGIAEGLTFGLIDKKQIFDALPGGGPDKLAPTPINAKTSNLGQSTTAGANQVMGKSEANTEKVIIEAQAKSPYAITQHFHGVTDKNFKEIVKVAMLEIEQKRNQK